MAHYYVFFSILILLKSWRSDDYSALILWFLLLEYRHHQRVEWGIPQVVAVLIFVLLLISSSLTYQVCLIGSLIGYSTVWMTGCCMDIANRNWWAWEFLSSHARALSVKVNLPCEQTVQFLYTWSLMSGVFKLYYWALLIIKAVWKL